MHGELIILHSAKLWRGKTLANRSFQSFDEENVGKFTVANISYYSNLGKIVVNNIYFPQSFPSPALYGMQ